jgi:hypothetical protein
MKRLLKKKINIFGKEISAFVIALFGVALVSAALIPYFGQIIGTVTVGQGLTLDGQNWDGASIVYSESLTSLEAKMISSGEHLLENNANVNAVIDLDTNCTGTDCSEISTTHDTVGLSTTWSWVAGANANASLSGDTVTLIADEHASDWSDASEARIRIDADDIENLLGLGSDLTLDDLTNISWEVTSGTGYAPHVDVFLEDGNVLVFEYAKVQTPYDNVASYPEGSFNTFNEKGIVDSNAEAWIQPGCPGGSQIVSYTLSEWKLGQLGDTYNFPCDGTGTVRDSFNIDGTTKVLGFEIEIDAWEQIPGVTNVLADISNIVINGESKTIETLSNPITIGNNGNLTFYVNSKFPKMLTPETYTLTTTINPA